LHHYVQVDIMGAPGLNSVALGLKEKLLAKGLSFEDAELAEPGVGGCPPAAEADSFTASPVPASFACATTGGSAAAAAAVLLFAGGNALRAPGGGGDGAEAASASGVACSDGDSAVSEADVEDGGLPPSWLNVRSFSRRSSRLATVERH
jgi:hypothetical protein